MRAKFGHRWCWATGWLKFVLNCLWKTDHNNLDLVGGHPYITIKENDRIYMECPHCGHTSRGWDLTARPAPKPVWLKQDYMDARAEMIEAELELIGGG